MLIACSGSSDTNIDGTQVIEPKAAEIKGLAKAAFGGVAFASIQAPAVHGGYAKGCLAGGVELSETGATWQAMRLSNNRNWAHPKMVTWLRGCRALRPSSRAGTVCMWVT